MRKLIVALVALLGILSSSLPSGATAEVSTPAAGGRPAGLVVGPTSWGPLEVGMTARQAQRTGMVSRELSACAPGYVMTERYADRGFVWWRGKHPNYRVQFLVIRGRVDRTRTGAGVGTTLRELRRDYPALGKLVSLSELRGQSPQRREYWGASIGRQGSVLTFQFDYSRRPTARSTVDGLVVARKPWIFPGC